MRAMPTGGGWHFGFRIAACLYSRRNDVDFTFPKTQSSFDRFHKTRAIFWIDRDSVLNDLHASTEPFDFRIGIHAHNYVVDPNAQITLLLQKLKERARLSFCGD